MRFAPGSTIAAPPDIYSQNGVLETTLMFESVVDLQGLTRYCYVSDTGLQVPTLHVYPGDQLIIHFQNNLSPAPAGMSMSGMKMAAHAHRAEAVTNPDCPGGAMTASTTNLHFHGMNVAPTCHQDDVVNTLIQPAGTFDYQVQIPSNEPPGLYWYHPHPHGFSNGQVQGGAAGALIVEGIENVTVPPVTGLPQRLFVLRDQAVPSSGGPTGGPSCDISVNYVPVTSPTFTPATLQTPPGEQEFWRVLNASADTIFNLQYVVNGVAQQVQVVAIDGIPVGQGSGQIQSISETSILLPAGARAEFIVATPGVTDQAQLVTQQWNSGPAGPQDPSRPIASVVAQATGALIAARLPLRREAAKITRFANLTTATPDGQRLLYFSESFDGSMGPTGYFVTVAGQTPAVYDPGNPPNIVVHQGTTEDWTVENRAQEDHVFHIHQIHFQVLSVNGQPVSDPALRDTVDVPHWSGTGPYPSVTLRMDFRDSSIVGMFVYHCHLLWHEDGGMMGAIQVLPAGTVTSTSIAASASAVNLNSPVTFTATVTPATSGTAVTGTVQFFADGVAVGNPAAVSNGTASLKQAFTAYGSHSVTAQYSGDSDCNESMSQAASVTVEDFALSASSTTLSTTAGQSASATITVAPSSGFNSTINFGCSLPSSFSEATCAVNPTSLTGSGKVTLTVTTTAPHKTFIGKRIAPPFSGTGPLAGAAAFLAFVCLFLVPRRKWREPATVGLFFFAFVFIFGCGGGAGSGGTTDPGTPSGNYSATVTATVGSGASRIQHALTVQVDVQ